MFKGVKKVVLLLALFLMIGTVLSTNSLANTSKGNVINSQGYTTQSAGSYYVTEYRNFYKTTYAAPPSTVYESRTINGFLYGGNLNRFQYVSDGDYWLTTYKGYVYAK